MIQQLPVSSYTSEDHLSEDHLSQADMALSQSEIPVRQTKDQSCQVGNALLDPFKDLTSLQENLEIEDIDHKDQTGKQVVHDEEQASSEEAVEQGTVKTSFKNIDSCTSMKDISMERNDNTCITHCCFFPSGRALLCVNNEKLMILDQKLKVIPYMKSSDYDFSVHKLATVDKETAVVVFQHRWIENERYENIQSFCFIPVTEELPMGEEIQLKSSCDEIAGFNKTVYVYSNDLKFLSTLQLKGVQVISKNGGLLKYIPLLDYLKDFSINSYGNITYVSETTCINGSKEHFFKCVTSKGDIVSCSPMDKKFLEYSWRVYDDDGNGIGYNTSDKQIEVLKLDGTVKPILVKKGGEERLSAMFYDKYSNTLLVEFNLYEKRRYDNAIYYDYVSKKLQLYRLE